MRQFSRRHVLAFGALAVLPACSLPRGAGRRREVLAGAGDDMPDFAVYEVNRASIDKINRWPSPGRDDSHGWIGRGGGGGAPEISVGDRLDLRIWDSDSPSLITGPEERVSEMPGVRVDSRGEVFVPFVGDVAVAGMTTNAARRIIQDSMESIAPSAQVQVSLASGRRNSVDVVSGVSSPGRYPLEDLDTSVLNVIAEAGGVSGLQTPRVRLTRGQRTYVTPLARLQSDPSQDTLLRGGDKLTVEEDDRFFIALGAAGREEVVTFDAEEVSAVKALSLMGGVEGSRADPRGVLILRRYPESAVGPNGPSHRRVAFSVDLISAGGLFSASEFAIEPGDLVLATESPITSVQTIFGLLGTSLGLASRTRDF